MVSALLQLVWEQATLDRKGQPNLWHPGPVGKTKGPEDHPSEEQTQRERAGATETWEVSSREANC